jgi:hypothetical protein
MLSGTITNSFFDSGRTLVNLRTGGTTSNGTAVDVGTSGYFYDRTHPPLSAWNFDTVWAPSLSHDRAISSPKANHLGRHVQQRASSESTRRLVVWPHRAKLAGVRWVPVMLVMAACGDDSAIPAGADGGRDDAGEGRDGGVPDATPPDSGAIADAGPAADAPAPLDGGGDDGGSAMCDPEAMPTPNAGLAEAPGEDGCPRGMLRVESFCVDRYEASLAVVNDDDSLTSWSPYFNPGDRRVRALSLAGAVPQAYVSGTQSANACAEAGKRLCTDAEWLRACQGPASTTYPYGDTRDPGICRDSRIPHPAVEYFGTSEDWIWSMLDHPCLDQLPNTVALTGAHAGCVTAEGAFDMMGNLHEWTADPAGTFRGGFYVDTTINGAGCLYRTTAHVASYWDYSTGFRCCADPL